MGFYYGFGAAAIGMGLGLAQYVAFRRNLGSHGRNVPDPLPRSGIAPVLDLVVIAVVVISVAVPVWPSPHVWWWASWRCSRYPNS